MQRTTKFLWSIIALLLPLCLSAQPLADGLDKYLGNVISNGSNVPDEFIDLWNQVTPENAGKWESVERVRDVMNWSNLDLIYDFAFEFEFPFREHCLVWGQQQPAWLAELGPEEQKAEVEEWIQAYGDRFPETAFIDVVNEPLHEDPVYKDAIGGDGETGWDWVIWTFEKAREYNPTAELHINEYGVLNGWVSINNYVKIINLLKDRNLIDGIGVQGHFLESVSGAQITSRLNQLAKTGLPIYVTEYDVNIADDDEHLAKFQDQIPALFAHPAVKGVTFWGYREGEMWRTDGFLRYKNGDVRPAMDWLYGFFANYTDVATHAAAPVTFELKQNYPNPFNPATTIAFTLPAAGNIELTIYNALGKQVKTLANGFYNAGQYSVEFNAADLSTGVYFYQLTANGVTTMKKMVFTK